MALLVLLDEVEAVDDSVELPGQEAVASITGCEEFETLVFPVASGTGDALSAELGAILAEEDADAGVGDVALGAPIPNSKAGLDSS